MSTNSPNNAPDYELSEDGTVFIKYNGDAKSFVVPDGVKKIGDRAFMGKSEIKYIKLPESLLEIGKNAFANCTSLKEIEIPASVTKIDERAFHMCCSLGKVVDLPPGIEIGDFAFSFCSSLNSIDIKNAKSIGEFAFANCEWLTKVEISGDVKKIRRGTFSGCGSLSSVHLSDGVESIEKNAFNRCSMLTSLVIPNSVVLISDSAFLYSGLESIQKPPKTVIGKDAFTGSPLAVSKTSLEARKLLLKLLKNVIEVKAKKDSLIADIISKNENITNDVSIKEIIGVVKEFLLEELERDPRFKKYREHICILEFTLLWSSLFGEDFKTKYDHLSIDLSPSNQNNNALLDDFCKNPGMYYPLGANEHFQKGLSELKSYDTDLPSERDFADTEYRYRDMKNEIKKAKEVLFKQFGVDTEENLPELKIAVRHESENYLLPYLVVSATSETEFYGNSESRDDSAGNSNPIKFEGVGEFNPLRNITTDYPMALGFWTDFLSMKTKQFRDALGRRGLVLVAMPFLRKNDDQNNDENDSCYRSMIILSLNEDAKEKGYFDDLYALINDIVDTFDWMNKVSIVAQKSGAVQGKEIGELKQKNKDLYTLMELEYQTNHTLAGILGQIERCVDSIKAQTCRNAADLFAFANFVDMDNKEKNFKGTLDTGSDFTEYYEYNKHLTRERGRLCINTEYTRQETFEFAAKGFVRIFDILERTKRLSNELRDNAMVKLILRRSLNRDGGVGDPMWNNSPQVFLRKPDWYVEEEAWTFDKYLKAKTGRSISKKDRDVLLLFTGTDSINVELYVHIDDGVWDWGVKPWISDGNPESSEKRPNDFYYNTIINELMRNACKHQDDVQKNVRVQVTPIYPEGSPINVIVISNEFKPKVSDLPRYDDLEMKGWILASEFDEPGGMREVHQDLTALGCGFLYVCYTKSEDKWTYSAALLLNGLEKLR